MHPALFCCCCCSYSQQRRSRERLSQTFLCLEIDDPPGYDSDRLPHEAVWSSIVVLVVSLGRSFDNFGAAVLCWWRRLGGVSTTWSIVVLVTSLSVKEFRKREAASCSHVYVRTVLLFVLQKLDRYDSVTLREEVWGETPVVCSSHLVGRVRDTAVARRESATCTRVCFLLCLALCSVANIVGSLRRYIPRGLKESDCVPWYARAAWF